MPHTDTQVQTKPAIKVGLTGGIGCGKSTVSQLFKEKGILLIDADLIAKEVVQPNQAALHEIIQLFGKSLLTVDGSLDRRALRDIVFKDEGKLKKLEAIIHPKVKQEILKKMAENTYNYPYIIVDVPLLIEKDYHTLFDQIFVVDCLVEQQFSRVETRDNTTAQQIQLIMNSQLERQERLKIADEVLDNTGSLDKLRKQVNELHERLCSSHEL